MDQNFEIAILFTVVDKPYNYVFGSDLLPHSPFGRGLLCGENFHWVISNGEENFHEGGAGFFSVFLEQLEK